MSLDDQEKLTTSLYLVQNSRHYQKISGNFDIIREPMYKYRKEVKERLFRDNNQAFLWMYYRCFAEFPVPTGREAIETRNTILQDFDEIALETLKRGPPFLFSYIHQLCLMTMDERDLKQSSLDDVTPGQYEDGEEKDVTTRTEVPAEMSESTEDHVAVLDDEEVFIV